MTSNAFFPNWTPNSHPVTVEQLKSTSVGTVSSFVFDTSSSFSASNVHFSGANATPELLIPSLSGANIVIYGINSSTTGSSSNQFGGVLFPDGYDYDVWAFVCTGQGPMFMDFLQPLVLPKGAALKIFVYAAHGQKLNMVSIRYCYADVAGAN